MTCGRKNCVKCAMRPSTSPAPPDLKGQLCPCGKGSLQETTINDDRDGVLHCTHCNKEVVRHPTLPQKDLGIDNRYQAFKAEAKRVAKAHGLSLVDVINALRLLVLGKSDADVRGLLGWAESTPFIYRLADEADAVQKAYDAFCGEPDVL